MSRCRYSRITETSFPHSVHTVLTSLWAIHIPLRDLLLLSTTYHFLPAHSISCMSDLCRVCLCCGARFKSTECIKLSSMLEPTMPLLHISQLGPSFCPCTECMKSGLVAFWCRSCIDGVNQLPKLCLYFVTPNSWFLSFWLFSSVNH